MRVAIISKIWQRPALTRAFLAYYSDLAERAPHEAFGLRVSLVAACTPEEDPLASMLMQESWPRCWFIPAGNDSLADKGNAACLAARELDPDVVLNVGSDDFVTLAYIERVVRLVSYCRLYAVPSELFIYDAPTGRAVRCFKNTGMKAGAAISRDLLDEVDWMPWLPGGTRPDADMDRRLGRVRRILFDPEPDEVVVDVKHEWPWISSFDEFRTMNKYREDADGAELIPRVPGLLEALRDAGVTG